VVSEGAPKSRIILEHFGSRVFGEKKIHDARESGREAFSGFQRFVVQESRVGFQDLDFAVAVFKPLQGIGELSLVFLDDRRVVRHAPPSPKETMNLKRTADTGGRAL